MGAGRSLFRRVVFSVAVTALLAVAVPPPSPASAATRVTNAPVVFVHGFLVGRRCVLADRFDAVGFDCEPVVWSRRGNGRRLVLCSLEAEPLTATQIASRRRPGIPGRRFFLTATSRSDVPGGS